MNTNQSQKNPKEGREKVLPKLIEDLQERDRIGIKKYGTSLMTHNGRSALIDAYEEVLDLAIYFKQVLMENEDQNA